MSKFVKVHVSTTETVLVNLDTVVKMEHYQGVTSLTTNAIEGDSYNGKLSLSPYVIKCIETIEDILKKQAQEPHL